MSEVAGTLALALLLVVAFLITRSRPRISADPAVRRRAAWIVLAAVAVQLLHFVEELVTGFRLRFPLRLGLAPWSATFFVAFNLAWIVVWICAAYGVRARLVIALVPLWFLGLAMVANGVAHPLLALDAGGYFPGLVTALPEGATGLWLLVALTRLTASSPPPR